MNGVGHPDLRSEWAPPMLNVDAALLNGFILIDAYFLRHCRGICLPEMVVLMHGRLMRVVFTYVCMYS